MRTLLIERGIVVVNTPVGVQIGPSTQQTNDVYGQPHKRIPRAASASEPEFFEQLEQRRPELKSPLQAFLHDVEPFGVEAVFRKSLVLRWGASPDFDASPGYIDSAGKVWLGNGWNSANRLGRPAVGDEYLEAVASLIGGRVRRYEKNWPEVVGPDGKAVDANSLLSGSAGWIAAIERLINETRVGVAFQPTRSEIEIAHEVDGVSSDKLE